MTDPIPGKEDITPAKLGPSEGQQMPEEMPSGKQFSEAMEQGGQTKATEGPSPLELAQTQGAEGKAVTPSTLNESLDGLKTASTSLQDQLTDQRFSQMSPGQKTLLTSKLNQFGQSVKGLSKQVGLDYDVPKASGPALKQVSTFLGWITGGQKQIATVQDRLQSEGPKMSVTSMMRAQAQMLAASRAINFATAVVGQGSDFVKTIMQTQI